VPYFREIEKLKVGDKVYVTNPWETLTYTVVSMDIINPDNSDAVLIQEGKDMITLITCHPYRSHGKYRYLVYCEREGDASKEDSSNGNQSSSSPDAEPDEVIFSTTSLPFESSQQDIEVESMLRIEGSIVILILILFSILPSPKKHRKHKKRSDSLE
jgi:sortase A